MVFANTRMIDGLRSFECLASVLATSRAGLPVSAARLLSQAPSTVYRAIDRLESEIGSQLFKRARSRWVLTETGKQIVRLAETVETETNNTELRILGSNGPFPSPVRISASDGIAEAYLAPVLAKIMRASENISFELVVDNQFADLSRREAHIAIRPSERPGDGLIGRRVGKLAHALYCAMPLLDRHGIPRTLTDLRNFKVCILSGEMVCHTAATWWKGRIQSQADVALVTNTEMSLASAVAAGAGVGILPCFIGDGLEGVGRISTILVGPPVDIWVVTASPLRRNPQIRKLVGALASAIHRDEKRLAGLARSNR